MPKKPPPVNRDAGRQLRERARARRTGEPIRHVGAHWCECLACHAGQLALRLPPTAPVAQPYDVSADRLVAGPGERRVCERDSACLDEWVRAHGDDEAHCPPRCPRWAPVDRHHYWVSAHAVRRHDSDGDLPDWKED